MVICDAGAFLAVERGNQAMWERLKIAAGYGRPPLTSAAVVAQVWRGGARQANLARALADVDVMPLTESLARKAGELLRDSRTSDVCDAALMLAAADGDMIVTSDPGDIAHLAGVLGLEVDIVPV